MTPAHKDHEDAVDHYRLGDLAATVWRTQVQTYANEPHQIELPMQS